MGRKLNLSHLSDEECKQVLAVIQRDFNIRQNEKDRIIKIQGAVENEAQKRLVLSRQLEFNKKHCICCFSTFGLIFNKKVKCEKCNFFICKDCKKQQDDNKEIICLPCDQQRELQERACQWYYDEMKAKFRRFGSAKVVRSLYKRQSESGTSESEHNSDSGVDHPFSPLLKKGGAFKRDGSADTIDEETNTDLDDSGSAKVYSSLLLQNPDWLKNYKPPSESIGVQFPDDDVDRSGKDYFDLLGEDRADGGERLQDNDGDDTDSDLYARRCHARLHPKVVTPDNQQTKTKANKTSQSNTKRDSGSSSTSSSSSQNTLQPPDKARDGVCMLSPIQEVSSPESSETQDADSVSKRNGADGSVFRFPQSEEGKRDGETLEEGGAGGTGRQEERVEEFLRNDEDGETTSPGEADSGIHMSFSSEDRQEQGNQDTPLRQPIRALDEMSESMEAFAAGVFRDIIHEEQPNSLETNVCSPRKNMSDVAPKGKAMFTQKYEASDRNGNLVEIEPVELSCSSDEDDFDDDIDQEEHCAMNFEEFMKQIQDTGTSKAREGSPHKKGSKSKKSSKDIESKHDRKVKDDTCSSPKRKAFSKRSHSAGDFRTRPEDQKKEKKPVKLSRSASNRFIRYDSLPLVVEVYEADAGSPSPSFKDSPRKQRFVYDGSPEIEATPEQNDQGLSATSGSSEESHSKSRQASVESGTTEGTFPKSTSISSLSSTTDGDRRRSADSVALKSSFDSDYDLINSPNHSVMKLCSPPGPRTGGDKPGEGDSKGSPEDCSEGAHHGNMGDRRQLSLVKQDQVPDEYESNCGEKKEEGSETPKTQTEEESADCNDTTENTVVDSTGDKGTELEEENPEGSLSAAQMSTPRKNKESIEIANLTKKFCMKQEEVLKSAEEVLSSASQLSEIQNHIDKLEQVLNSLERKVAGEGSSMSSFESDEIYTPPPSPNTASSLVSEDVECLHRDLVHFPAEVTSPSEINMASAVRMITATALKVLSTTEDVMDAHLDEDAPKPDDQISLAKGLDGYESGPMDLASPQSQTSASPSSTGSMIFRVTSGKDSPPTATLLFSYDDMKEAVVQKPECLDSEGAPQDLKGDDDESEKEETTVMVLEDDNLFADDVIMSDREDLDGDLEVSVFDHHFSVKNGIVDPLTLLYNQVTELEEKVYLSAGKVYTLEERLLQLEQEVETIDDNIAEEILAALEDKLALTVAQVSQNDVEVSSVENEIAGLESSGAGKVMSSVYSLDNTLPFRVSTATYYFNQPDLDQYDGGMIEVRIPSDGLIESMKAADPDNYTGPDSDWGTVVVRRISQPDGNDDDGKAEFHWSDLIENRGGNSETDENENGLERPENESIDSDVSEPSEKYRSTFILVVDPDGWKEPASVEANFRKQDE